MGALAVVLAGAAPAHADLVFTAAGNLAFPGQHVAVEYHTGGYGDPNGVATGNGGLAVGFGNQHILRVISPDQTTTPNDFTGGNPSNNPAYVSGWVGNVYQLTQLAGYVYVGGAGTGNGQPGLARFNPADANPVVSSIGTARSAWGIAADAQNNTVYSTTAGSHYNLVQGTNVNTGATTMLFTGGYDARFYQLAVSQNGTTVYAVYDPENGSRQTVIGIDVTTGNQVFAAQNSLYDFTAGLVDVMLNGQETLLATGTTVLPGTTTQTKGLYAIDLTSGVGTLLAYDNDPSSMFRDLSYNANTGAVLAGRIDYFATSAQLVALQPASAVPAPSGISAMLAGLAGLGFAVRRPRAD
jgi:hypothetical protein